MAVSPFCKVDVLILSLLVITHMWFIIGSYFVIKFLRTSQCVYCIDYKRDLSFYKSIDFRGVGRRFIQLGGSDKLIGNSVDLYINCVWSECNTVLLCQ